MRSDCIKKAKCSDFKSYYYCLYNCRKRYDESCPFLKKPPERIRTGRLYILIKDYQVEYYPCLYEGKKGDIVQAENPNLGFARFYHVEKRRKNQREHPLILMTPKEAFKYVREFE